MSILQDRFIERVNFLLRERGISRAELARRMGVSQPVPLDYLNRKTSPGFDMVEKFAEALGVDPGELLGVDSPWCQQVELTELGSSRR